MIAYGLAWVIWLVLAAAFLMGLFDYTIRSEDYGVRIICSALVLVVFGWTFYRFLLPVFRLSLGDVHIAQRIEGRYREMGDRFSSAVEFVRQEEDDPTAGSAALRRTVIAEAAADVERFNLSDTIDYGRHWRVVLGAAVTVAVVALTWLCFPESTSRAARRLVMPLSGETWPRVNRLAFVDPPRRLPLGEDFEVELIDENNPPDEETNGNGRLPDDVKIFYWFEGEPEKDAKAYDMEYDFSRGRMVHRLTKVTRSFKYRAVGGDDDTMPWLSLEVVEPSRIASMQIDLHPPAYTGWPPESSDRNLRTLEGTRVAVTAEVTKPLSAAVLKLETGPDDSQMPARLSDDGLKFEISAEEGPSWVIGKSGAYWFELTDRDSLKRGAGHRWEIRAIPDRPPAISLQEPSGNAFVTVDAVVPIRILVKDDLAIHTVHLRYVLSDQGEEEIELYRGADDVAEVEIGGLQGAAERGDSRLLEYGWDLSRLEGLVPGAVIELHVAANDYKPQQSRCPPRRLTIITADELQDRIAQRQTHILGQLGEALRIQRESRSQTTGLSIRLEETGRLGKEDVDQLQSAELNQRQVRRLLTSDRDGLKAQIEALLADLESNRVDNPDIRRRMTSLVDTIRFLDDEHLPVIQQELVTAMKSAAGQLARGRESESGKVGPSLTEAGRRQDEVIAALEQMRDQLAKWDSYRRFAREIRQLRHDQTDLAENTAKLRLQTLTKDVRDLTSQERADLKTFSQKQLELALRLEKIVSRMVLMQGRLAQTDPLAAETIGDAVDVARRRAVGGQMRAAGGDVAANRLSTAAQLHGEIDESLLEMLDVLANRREHELTRLVGKLAEAAGELRQTRELLKQLREKMKWASNLADPQRRQRELQRLVKEQQQLQEQLDRLARRLMRLQAQRPGQTVGDAAAKLGRCQQAQQQGDAAKASKESELAEEDLEKAEKQLAQRLRQARQDLVEEQVAQLQQQVKGMRSQQETMLNETVRLDDLRKQHGRLTRGQLASVRSLAQQQRALFDETEALAAKIAPAEVFHLALSGAAQQMKAAADRLDQLDTAEATQLAQSNAQSRLDLLLVALAPESGDDDDSGGAGSAGGASGGGNIRHLAELKLLKLLQEEINRRTADLQAARGQNGPFSDEQLRELEALAAEQGRLAELIFNLTEPGEENPEDDPNNLPDVREEGRLDDELEKSLEGILPPIDEE